MTTYKRQTPDPENVAALGLTEPVGEDTYVRAVDLEVRGLWERTTCKLITIGGTANAITAQCEDALLTAYSGSMSFIFYPILDNTGGAATINIDTIGNVSIKDRDGADPKPKAIVAGRLTRLFFDGTNMVLDERKQYLVSAYASGRPDAAEEILRHVLPFAVTYPAGMTLSRAKAKNPAAATTVFSLQKNDVQFGTVTFAPASATGTFAAAANTSFAADDVLTVVAPDPRDNTLDYITMTLIGAA